MYIDHFCTIIATSILKGGLQPLHYAASGGHLDIMRRLIEVYKVPPDSAATVRQKCLYSIRNPIIIVKIRQKLKIHAIVRFQPKVAAILNRGHPYMGTYNSTPVNVKTFAMYNFCGIAKILNFCDKICTFGMVWLMSCFQSQHSVTKKSHGRIYSSSYLWKVRFVKESHNIFNL